MLALTYCFACLRGGPPLRKPSPNLRHVGRCWGHVGTFFAPGRLFFVLGHIFNHFLLILNAFWSLVLLFFACWDAQNMILEGPGKVLEALRPCFSFVFRINEHALPSCSQYNKTVIFARFYRLQNTAHTAKTNFFGVALKAFLDMVLEWLPKIPAGIHFLVFASTLQRGGTCEAHGIRRPPTTSERSGVSNANSRDR